MSTAPNTTKKKKMSPYKLRGRLADFGYALPALLFFIVFTYYPVVELFRISLTNWNLMKDNYAYVGFKNYIWLFSSTGTGLKRLAFGYVPVHTGRGVWLLRAGLVAGTAV